MKKISILIPCYNEEENVGEISNAIVDEFNQSLSQYDYEIVFIDNASTDRTRSILREVCRKNKKIKAIFNIRNFGQNNSPYYGLLQTTGDCTIAMSCDFQDPVEMIPQFVREWENGYTVVTAIKKSSKENPIMYFFRTMYYKIFKKMSQIDSIQHFTGFGLYDKSFIDIMRELDDPIPFLRGIVAEYGYNRKAIEFEQPKRKHGVTHNNFNTLYSIAMRSFTNYTKLGIRTMSLISIGVCITSIVIAFIYFILKLIYWQEYPNGTVPILLVVLVLGSFQTAFLGLIGEYIFSINERVIHRPLVIEEERINFEESED